VAERVRPGAASYTEWERRTERPMLVLALVLLVVLVVPLVVELPPALRTAFGTADLAAMPGWWATGKLGLHVEQQHRRRRGPGWPGPPANRRAAG
jgi:hypothetical protein